MKTTWEMLSKQIDNQEKLTNQLIERVTAQNFRSTLSRIVYPEYAGALVCYAGAAYLIWNFTRIDLWLMQIFGIVAIVLLIILPIISFISVRELKSVKFSIQSYSETIRKYARQKIRFQKLQTLNIALAMIVMLTSIPVLVNIQGKEITSIPYFWTLLFPTGIALFFAFTFWVLRHYNNALKEAEEVLSEIND